MYMRLLRRRTDQAGPMTVAVQEAVRQPETVMIANVSGISALSEGSGWISIREGEGVKRLAPGAEPAYFELVDNSYYNHFRMELDGGERKFPSYRRRDRYL